MAVYVFTCRRSLSQPHPCAGGDGYALRQARCGQYDNPNKKEPGSTPLLASGIHSLLPLVTRLVSISIFIVALRIVYTGRTAKEHIAGKKVCRSSLEVDRLATTLFLLEISQLDPIRNGPENRRSTFNRMQESLYGTNAIMLQCACLYLICDSSWPFCVKQLAAYWV